SVREDFDAAQMGWVCAVFFVNRAMIPMPALTRRGRRMQRQKRKAGFFTPLRRINAFSASTAHRRGDTGSPEQQ
ncbi:MAG: hypothetical protein ABI158_00760, partial [Edaphobacter sp.]